MLGCLACYYGLNSSILDSLVNKLKCHFVIEGAEEENEEEHDTVSVTPFVYVFPSVYTAVRVNASLLSTVDKVRVFT